MGNKKLKDTLQLKLRQPPIHNQKHHPHPQQHAKPAKPTQTRHHHQPRRPPVMPFVEWDTILFVGEGNFSFAHAVLEKLHAACDVTATSYDSEHTVREKYPDAATHIDAIRDLGGDVQWSVDATALEKWKAGRTKRFSKIVFNFPHVGAGLKDKLRNIDANQSLIHAFLLSACTLLAPHPTASPPTPGEILITLKTGDPYDLWDVKAQARRTGVLACARSFEFVPSLYPEYSHRRTIGYAQGRSADANEEIVRRAPPRTWAFVVDLDLAKGTGKRKAGARGGAAAADDKDSAPGKRKKKRRGDDSESDD
ncbi:hypothetical protein HDU87_006264 [Geranomyces variabilis]|uniref:25S rRNA (uridine-N(3))-methyltransferase BMT5-like domain-containing protein n=1 Tax=Geranomyces variabilis TaxID=109894 RepID=A0AAD5TH73_9FUNG|nr:hypothetical protein HDU87_006264 [Geranomyces variabilis]